MSQKIPLDISSFTWRCKFCDLPIEFTDDPEMIYRHVAIHCLRVPEDHALESMKHWQSVCAQSRESKAVLAHAIKHPDEPMDVLLIPPVGWRDQKPELRQLTWPLSDFDGQSIL